MSTFQWLFIQAAVATLSVALPQEVEPAERIKPAPGMRLSTAPYPQGVTDEAAYASWLSHRSEALWQAAERADDPSKHIELGLAATNWVLAAECEPPMSRILQGIIRDSDRSLIGKLTQRSLNRLQTLREDVKQFTRQGEHDAEVAAGFGASIDTLEAFTRAIGACSLSDKANEKTDFFNETARLLSAYIEDERPEVAAAALLWQAVLYGRSGRIDAALRMMPLAEEPLPPDAKRYAFFTRLLRCQYLGQKGAQAVSWTLLLALEERARDWFDTARTQTEAARSAIWAKLAICNDWPARVPAVEQQKTKSWCDSIVARLRDRHFADEEHDGLLRLTTAVPIVVNIPEPGDLRATPPPTPSTQTGANNQEKKQATHGGVPSSDGERTEAPPE